MPKYNVSIEIDYKSYHEEEIEAEDEDEAETIAQENFYNEEYEDELRMNMETDDESYNAVEIIDMQICPVCKKVYYKDNPDDNPINVGYEPVEAHYNLGYTINKPVTVTGE